MSDFKKPLTYVIIESETRCKYQVIGCALSIQRFYPQCTIVLVACEATRETMKKIPLDLICNIDYFDCDDIYSSNFNVIRKYLHNIYKTSLYVVKKYERCLFVNEELTMINDISFRDEIEEQGYGFVNKYFKGHNIDTKPKEYTFELIFMNNLKFINILDELLREKYDIDITSLSAKRKPIGIPQFNNLPLDLINKNNIDKFLLKQNLIATEDFLGFKDQVKLVDISRDFKYNDELISFIGIRIFEINPDIKSFNKLMLDYLTISKSFIIPIVTIKFFCN